METLEINIALDPINDGAVMKETKLKRKDEGALVLYVGKKKLVKRKKFEKFISDNVEI